MSPRTADRRPGPDRDGSDAVVIEVTGGNRLTLSRTDLVALSSVERECSVVCASEGRITATWTGVPVPDLLAAADAPPSTTHLRLTSADGYRAFVGVAAGLDALVAVARDGESLAAGERRGARFVGPDVDGVQSVKGLRRIDPVALDPDEDPAELAARPPDDSADD